MKRLICFILTLLILPTTLLLTGCKDKESRSMLDFYSNYLKIADSSQYLETQPLDPSFNASSSIKKVGFAYSPDLQDKIANIQVFTHINDLYNKMLDDAMGPTYLFSASLISAKIKQEEKSQLYSNLDQLKEALLEIANRVGDLERTQDSQTALQNLNKLFKSYEPAINVATKISSQISSIYYSRILNTPNPNYIEMDIGHIDLNSIASRTLNRLVYYKSIFVDIFYQTQIKGYDIPQQLINGSYNQNYTPYSTFKDAIYSSSQLNLDLEDYRTELVAYARSLYLIQNDFDSEYLNFKNSASQINYCTVNNDSTEYAKGHKKVIDKFISENGLAYSTSQIIKTILDICYL